MSLLSLFCTLFLGFKSPEPLQTPTISDFRFQISDVRNPKSEIQNPINAIDSSFYDIKIKIKDFKSPKALLCYYYGDQTFLVDSTQVDTLNGAMRFTQNKRLPEGVYFIAKPEGVVMDFIVAGWKDFSISTTSNSLYDSAKVENSRENEVFFDYMRAIQHTAAQSAQMREMNQMLRKATKDRKVLEENERKFVELYQNLEKTLKNTIQDNPSLYITKLLLANQQPDVPDNIKPYTEDKKINPIYPYYLAQNYWSNFDFSDERLLRSPYYITKVKEYVSRVVSPNQDSINVYTDLLLSKMKSQPLYYKYTLKWLTQWCDEDNYGKGNDAFFSESLFIHLVDTYHGLKTSGTDTFTLQRLRYKADAFRSNRIGVVAPNFSLPDTLGAIKSLSDSTTKLYTLVAFYSPICSHCQERMPKFAEILKTVNPEVLKVYAIDTDGNRDKWFEFIRKLNLDATHLLDSKSESEMQIRYGSWNLPALYLLDKDKKIVAKNITPERLALIVNQLNTIKTSSNLRK